MVCISTGGVILDFSFSVLYAINLVLYSELRIELYGKITCRKCMKDI